MWIYLKFILASRYVLRFVFNRCNLLYLRRYCLKRGNMRVLFMFYILTETDNSIYIYCRCSTFIFQTTTSRSWKFFTFFDLSLFITVLLFIISIIIHEIQCSNTFGAILNIVEIKSRWTVVLENIFLAWYSKENIAQVTWKYVNTNKIIIEQTRIFKNLSEDEKDVIDLSE